MFDDIIKKKADEHEALVPPDAWDNIAKKKKKRRLVFWWWSSALLLLLAVSAGGYYLLNNKNSDAVVAVEKTKDAGIASKRESDKQAGNNQEDKTAISSPASKTVIKNTAPVDTSVPELNSGPKNSIDEKATTTISLSATEPEDNRKPVANRNNKTKKIKGRLKVTQLDPGIGDDMATEKNIKAGTDEPVAEEDDREQIRNDRSKDVAVADAPDNKVSTAEEEEKKTSEIQKSEPQVPLNKEKKIAPKQKIKKHWFIEAAAIPLVASSHYNDNIPFNRTISANNSVSVYRANLKKASIEPAVAFSMLLRREVSKKVSLGTGVQYMLLKENIRIEGKETQTTHTIVNRLVNGQLVPDTVTTVTQGSRAIAAVNSYQLLSIPAFVQYRIIEKSQWQVSAVGGFYFNISSNYKNEIDKNAAAPLRPAPGTTNKSNTGMDLFAGVRIGKKLSSRLDLFAMPSIRLSLAKYNIKNSLLDKNINQAGVGFGLCYKIK